MAADKAGKWGTIIAKEQSQLYDLKMCQATDDDVVESVFISHTKPVWNLTLLAA